MRYWPFAAVLFAAAIGFAAIDLTGLIGLQALPQRDVFGPGVFVGPVDVSHLSVEEAAAKLQRYFRPSGDEAVTLTVAGEPIAVRQRHELGIEFDIAQSVSEALASERPRRRIVGARQAERHPVRWRVDEDLLESALRALSEQVLKPPRNARIDPGSGSALPHQNGWKLDVERASGAVRDWVKDVARGVISPSAPVKLTTTTLAPHVDVQRLMSLQAMDPQAGRTFLTGYATRFDSAQTGRTHNVALAARLIDGYVLMPGEEFSFNRIVGERTLSAGFLPAPEIVGHEFVEGVGGGICQVSSTLYNAALYADLEIVERYRHSVPLGYVPPGRDATLQYGVMDFRFRNTTGNPLIIRAEVDGDRLRVSLWGSRPLDHVVDLASEERVIPPTERVTMDPGLPVGEVVVDDPGEAGKWIFVYKTRRDPHTGEVISEEVFSRNYYPPSPRVMRVGTGVIDEESAAFSHIKKDAPAAAEASSL